MAIATPWQHPWRHESSRSSEKGLYSGRSGHNGHYEHPGGKVEGLVGGFPRGSSSLPGRTHTGEWACLAGEEIDGPGVLGARLGVRPGRAVSTPNPGVRHGTL